MEIYSLLKKDWDIAVILDACRYDTFKSIHSEYLEGGRLEKRTGASCTTHWLQSVFQDTYPDIIYISGNPWINSLEGWDGFKPNEKFKEIWDVWNWAWNDKYETVLPTSVTEGALKANKKYPDEKLIIHYLQPHYPYLSNSAPKDVKMYFDGVYGKERESNTFSSFISKHINHKLERLLGREIFWKIRDYMRIKTNHIEEYLWRNYTEEELMEFYKENLRLVLTEVMRLLDNLKGKIIITSDHGEAFGEEGDFFHPYGTENPVVRNIPYWSKKI